MSVSTFYPDIDASVGVELGIGNGVAWSTIRSANGNYVDKTSESTLIYVTGDNQANKWMAMYRTIFLFDTSILGSGATISSAVLSVVRYNESGNEGINVYGVDTNADDDVVAADYQTFLDTPLCDTPILGDDMPIQTYADFNLNIAGLARINKTGITKIGLRLTDDAENTARTWASITSFGVDTCATEHSGGTYKPKLVITYTTGTSWPSDPITRVTGLVHRYSRKERSYTLEATLGGVTTDFGLPTWEGTPTSTLESSVEDTSTVDVPDTSESGTSTIGNDYSSVESRNRAIKVEYADELKLLQDIRMFNRVSNDSNRSVQIRINAREKAKELRAQLDALYAQRRNS